MIFESILSLILVLLNPLISLMPDIDFSLTLDSASTVIQIIRTGLYFLPVDTVVLILGCILTLQMMKIAIALVKAVLSFVPFM